jgi:adenylate cyclase
MARLFLTTAEGTHAVELRAVNSLGRHPNNTIQLLDKIVSKEHCIIEQRGDHFVLRDLGSLNGTYINNERVRGEAPLKHGDEIALGATRGKFDDGSSPLQGQPAGMGPAGAQGQPPSAQNQGYQRWQPGAQQGGMQQGGMQQGGMQQGGMQQGGMGQLPGMQPPPGMGQPGMGQPGGLMPGMQPPPSGASPMAQSQAVSFGRPPQAQQANYPPHSGQMPPSTQGYPGSGPGLPPQQQQGGSYPPSYGNQPPAMVPPHLRPGGTAPLDAPRHLLHGMQGYGQQQPGHGTGRGPVVGSFVAQGTRIDVSDQARQIGTQIDAVEKGFLAFDRIANDINQLRADYERLRLSHELSHAIGIERDTNKLLEKILASVLKFITADRAVIFLRDDSGELRPQASQRRDGTTGPITISSTILDHVVKERAAVLTHDAAMDFAASKGKSMILNRISSAIVAPLLQHDNEVLGVLWLDSETLARFQAKDLELVQTVANQAARFIEINILGKKVEAEIVSRERLSRLLSPNIAEQVISGRLEVKPGGQRVEECTVFNSDIRGFTRMSESTSPEALVEMLNEYFETMVDTIFKYDGTLDKFMGDGIMALWGAPLQTPEDAFRSVECALEMGEALGHLNRRRLEKDESPLAVGIGIHTGPLVAGYIGSSKALSYTVIGDTANTSARLCSHALAGQVIVSENTLVRLKNRFEVEELSPAKVKGKEKPLRIFNVLRPSTKVQVPANAFVAEPTSAISS